MVDFPFLAIIFEFIVSNDVYNAVMPVICGVTDSRGKVLGSF